MVITHFESHQLIAEVLVEQNHANLNGGLHGGFSATLVDKLSSLTLVTEANIRNNAKPNFGKSVNLSVNYVRPANIGDILEIHAKCNRLGKNLAYMSVQIMNKADGKLLAIGSHIKFMG